jgi:hypothetical protein
MMSILFSLELGEEAFPQPQIDRWACPDCGGRALFYEYQGLKCGKDEIVIGR